jgi:hypothetical protein
MHVNGTNVDQYIALISNFENTEQLLLRKKTRISNRHIFNSLIRIINKIFSAKGGSTYYELDDQKSEEFRETISDIKGVALRKWIQNKGLNKYVTDPNGIFLVENKQVNGKRYCYPTYKCVTAIKDYQHTGRKLEYVIMPAGSDPNTRAEYFRVYDDARDRIVKYINNEVITVDFDEFGNQLTFPNLWGEVPGFLVGDMPHNTLEMYDSRFSLSMELADKYLRTNSVKNVYEFAHGFPLMWRMLTAKCTSCNGTGFIDGKMHGDCKGTGYQLRKDVSDVIGVMPPKTADEPKLVPDIAGYVQPDLETWREFRTELEWLETAIQYAILGSYTREKAGAPTATGVWVDVQPVNDSLNDYADWVEETEQLITDYMGQYYYGADYKGSSINLGRRYMIEKPDDLWKKYLESRTQGAPTEKLDDDITEYYESKYMNDAKTLEVQMKLFFANPYRHVTIEEAKSSLPEKEYLKRVYYDYWVSRVNQAEVLGKDYLSVQEMFIDFYNQKIKEDATSLSGSKS